MKYINILTYENRQYFLRLWKVEGGFEEASLREVNMEVSTEPIKDWFVSHLFCFVFGMFRDNFVIVKQNAQLPFQGNFHCKLCRHEAQGSVFLALRSP